MTNDAHGVLCLALLMLIGAFTGCSGRDPEVASNETPPITPRLDQESLDQDARTSESTEDLVSAEVAAGGIPTTYQAYFSGGQLVRISETRARDAAELARGNYEFQGARLLEYTGQSLAGGAALELEFDLQGRLIVARAGARDASAEEISDLRGRAQLLRSHALAQRASRMHGMSKKVDR